MIKFRVAIVENCTENGLGPASQAITCTQDHASLDPRLPPRALALAKISGESYFASARGGSLGTRLGPCNCTELTAEVIEAAGEQREEPEGDQVPEAGGDGRGHVVGVDLEAVRDQDDHDHDGAQDGAGDGRTAHGRGGQDEHVGAGEVPAQEDGDEGGHACHDQRLALRGGGGG